MTSVYEAAMRYRDEETSPRRPRGQGVRKRLLAGLGREGSRASSA